MFVRTLATTLPLALSLALPLALTTATYAATYAGDCADQRASDIPGEEVESKKHQRCGLGLQLFGYDLDLLGERCPKWVKVYPDHQECTGEELLDHECVFDRMLDVVRLECDCSDATLIFDTGLAFPNCDCDFGGSAGQIQTFATRACEGL